MASRAVTVAVVVGGAAGAYLLALGWHRQKHLGADGYLHGPYSAGQITLVAAVLVVLALWARSRGAVGLGAVAATITVDVLFSVEADTDPQSDGLWPVGALLVAVATYGGFWLVGILYSLAVRARWDGASDRGPRCCRPPNHGCRAVPQWDLRMEGGPD
jgi:hypothetical protein